MTISWVYENYSRFYIPLLSETFRQDYNYYWASILNTSEDVILYSWHVQGQSTTSSVLDGPINHGYYEQLFETPLNTKLGQALYGKVE